MTDQEQKEREAVLREREAFVAGIEHRARNHGIVCSQPLTCESCAAVAKSRYPLPKVTRPRVVAVDGAEYRVIGSRLEVKITGTGSWVRSPWVPSEIATLAELIANPLETADAE